MRNHDVVLAAILNIAKENSAPDLSIRNVTAVANTLLSNGDLIENLLTPRGVGVLVQQMGLRTARATTGDKKRNYAVVWDEKKIAELTLTAVGPPSPAQVMGKMATGVWGFCVRCGDVVEVVVTADDRLQNRLVRAAALIATSEGWPSLEALARLRMQLGEAHVASSVGKSLANYGLIDGDPLRASRSAAIELRRRMQEEMAALVIAELSLAQWLGEPVDLMREATENLERRAEEMGTVNDGN